MKKSIITSLVFLIPLILHGQNFEEKYNAFKKEAHQQYSNFRNECNHRYAEFLRNAWNYYEGKEPIPRPKEEAPLPPKPYKPDDEEPVTVEPVIVKPLEPTPQPTPVEPIREQSDPIPNYFEVSFYGIHPKVRMPEENFVKVNVVSPYSISDAWMSLCAPEMDNAIRDCIENRIRYNLCDWAYLQFLDALASQYCEDKNAATLLMAFLYCQSGYQMRLAEDRGALVMLFGSEHVIYEKKYFVVDDLNFYPYNATPEKMRISAAEFEGEKPLSFVINSTQNLGTLMSEERATTSVRYPDVHVVSQVPLKLLDFYNLYPSSMTGGNKMTRWAMYANTPLAENTRDILYPKLKKSISDLSKPEAANRLLNWVQTGFEYEYDDKVWGHDRPFFAEETLFYPYCDCEDRSILFSRLIRDLLGLDVALVYYPGHLATAVKFDTEMVGDAIIIDGERYVICDPTYIGAPIGKQMPEMDGSKAEAIILNRF